VSVELRFNFREMDGVLGVFCRRAALPVPELRDLPARCRGYLLVQPGVLLSTDRDDMDVVIVQNSVETYSGNLKTDLHSKIKQNHSLPPSLSAARLHLVQKRISAYSQG
jgi:hypothetical protein